MYKVILVDDEPWALKAISLTFPWQQMGFEVVLHTTNPLDALEAIKAEKPDVVFTDIRMPGISGIELMQRTREMGLDIEFIIISGFAEFSYAQEAVELGAFSYCLKPLETEKAHELLSGLKDRLSIKLRDRKNAVLELLLEGTGNECSQLLASIGFTGIYNLYQGMMVVCGQEQPRRDIFLHMDAQPIVEFELKWNKSFYIINTDRNFTELIRMDAVPGIVIGVSSMYDTPDDLRTIFREADTAVNNHFIYPGQRVFTYRKKSWEAASVIANKTHHAITAGNGDEIRSILKGLGMFFRDHQLGIEDLIYFWNRIITSLQDTYGTILENTELNFIDYEEFIMKYDHLDEMGESLLDDIEFLEQYHQRDSTGVEPANNSFMDLLHFINEHYSEQLYLKDLSSRFFINRSYCCELFKKVTGQTFSEYLTRIRIEHAKELLHQGRQTIVEVANSVGFNDYYYFNKTFKKQTGTTPNRYRHQSKP